MENDDRVGDLIALQSSKILQYRLWFDVKNWSDAIWYYVKCDVKIFEFLQLVDA
ncbi:MAG: hypothetical protein KME46_06755 [Brasilonema angustatum HA4187-MV1]|jgi:hypothetical protein|nr:hypothetical protein [Brasilonema angustatum HA4187-MV1]